MALSDLTLRKATITGKQYKLFDRDGLHILIKPSGSKIWKVKYSFYGTEKTLTLGNYPEISLQEARNKTLNARTLLSDGIDPSQRKQEEKQNAIYKSINTFESIAREWHDTTQRRLSPKHYVKVLSRMENHLFPSLGQRIIDTIKPLDVLFVLQKVEAKGKIDTTHRLLNYTQNIFKYAVITGRTETNPARELGMALKPKQQKHLPTIQADELENFLAALTTVNTAIQNKLAVKLQLLTFLRTTELRQSKWKYIDFEKREWQIPAELMKMKNKHVVPLSDYTISVLKKLERLTGCNDYLFPNRQNKVNPFMSENTINYVIEKMGYKGKIVGHGFRSLASTTLNENGFNRDAIEMQLAHKEPNKVRAAYNHAQYMQERVVMMQWWAQLVKSLDKSIVC